MRKKFLAAMLTFFMITSSPIYANEAQVLSENIFAEDDEAEFIIPTDEIPNELDPIIVQDNKVILTLNKTTALVEGKTIELLTPPKVIEGVTLLPLRFIGDHVIGATTIWDQATKTVMISKGDTTVRVTVDSKSAFINGLEVELNIPPQIINNTTLLPLRFISEAFKLPIDYNPQTKEITLIKENKQVVEPIPEVKNTAPVASFYFPSTYIAGQEVSVVNTSIDPDGDTIVDQLWSVEGSKRVTNRDLSKMFKMPRAGTYTIGLQVQDSKGAWSDWTYETITIQPNAAPVITSFKANKASYAQGEALEFTYTYDNETWEAVKEGKWTYRAKHEAANRAVVGKPEALFTPGEYIITLYLDDDYGNRSKGIETVVTITDQIVMSELQYRFTKGKIGDWIDNFQGLNYLNYAVANIEDVTYDEGTLIMSDSPEMVVGSGILYRDSITGTGRLLIHHINNIFNSTTKQRLAVIIENTTDQMQSVTLKNKAIKGPSTDILRVGQLALSEYLKGTASETIKLAPGERKYIYEQAWTANTCISGHVDVETTGKVNFIIANMSESDTLQKVDQMHYFPADGVHYSGTYNMLGIHYNVKLDGMQPERLTLGVANANEWAVGYDERTHTTVENTGNYGITYYVTVTAAEDMGLILNNRGGIFQGAVKWQGENVYNMPGNGSFNGTTTKAVVLGTMNKGETKTFEYLLPNGSATPTLIGFIPKSHW